MPLPSAPPPPPPTHFRLFASTRVGGYPYTAWKMVTLKEWEAATPEQRQGWRDEAKACLLNTIKAEKGPAAAASARVTY